MVAQGMVVLWTTQPVGVPSCAFLPRRPAVAALFRTACGITWFSVQQIEYECRQICLIVTPGVGHQTTWREVRCHMKRQANSYHMQHTYKLHVIFNSLQHPCRIKSPEIQQAVRNGAAQRKLARRGKVPPDDDSVGCREYNWSFWTTGHGGQFFQARTNQFLCEFPDMPCMKRVYRDKKASVHSSASRNEERFSSRR